jgi:hypothetical protein
VNIPLSHKGRTYGFLQTKRLLGAPTFPFTGTPGHEEPLPCKRGTGCIWLQKTALRCRYEGNLDRVTVLPEDRAFS